MIWKFALFVKNFRYQMVQALGKQQRILKGTKAWSGIFRSFPGTPWVSLLFSQRLNHLITKICTNRASSKLRVLWFPCLQSLCKHGNQRTRNHYLSVWGAASLKSLKVKILYKPSKFSNAVFFLSVFTKDACKHRQKEHRIIDWFEAQLR